MIHAQTIIGWTLTGDLYCLDCREACRATRDDAWRADPVFADAQVLAVPCDRCGRTLGQVVGADRVSYGV